MSIFLAPHLQEPDLISMHISNSSYSAWHIIDILKEFVEYIESLKIWNKVRKGTWQ